MHPFMEAETATSRRRACGRGRLAGLLVSLCAIAPLPALAQAASATSAALTPGLAPVQAPVIGAPFMLVNPAGKPVTDKQFRGRWLLAFFGYTFCPDVCPTTLTTLTEAFAQMGPDAQQVQALFISLDPRRDTPELLGRYMANFSPRITAATGTEAQVAAAAKAFRVRYETVGDVASGSYMLNHPLALLLFNPQGRFVTLIPGGVSAAELRTSLAGFMHQSP